MERSRGTVSNQDSSGMAAVDIGVKVGVGVAEGVVELGVGEIVDEAVAFMEK